jgi:hypothetical protein
MTRLPPFTFPLSPAVVLLVILASAAAGVALLDPAPTIGVLKGDEATYVAMAGSLAFDGDLQYTADDYRRIREWYRGGPEGIFLQRDSAGALHFGKAYLYAVAALPFAWGGLRGLFLLNLLCVGFSVVAGYWWLKGRSHPVQALLYSVVFVVASATALYSAWLTSEILNYTLVFLAFVIGWPRSDAEAPGARRTLLALGILAAAVFSKPLNVLLAFPLALSYQGVPVRRVAFHLSAFALALAVFFGINFSLTGNVNYQGGDRKTFYGRFPFDEHGGSFETTGIRRAVDPMVAPIENDVRVAALPRNAWYFLAGRHFGLIPFGWPWLLSLLAWAVLRRPKPMREWVLVGSVMATAVVTMVLMPYTWFGGGGPIGNRYFLSVAASLFFLTPALTTAAIPLAGAAGLLFMAPLYTAPFQTVRQPWRATQNTLSRLLPLEMTGASDFPIILDKRRGRVPQGRRPTVFVSLISTAAGFGTNGWIAVDPMSRAELLVRSEPLDRIIIGVKSESPCRVTLTDRSSEVELALGPNDRRDTTIVPLQTYSLESYAFVVNVDATACTNRIQVAMQGRSRQHPTR